MSLLTLNSPGNRNALSQGLVAELKANIDAVGQSSSRALFIVGTDTAFCSGADLTDPPVGSGRTSYPEVLMSLWNFPKLVIALVNGHVRAGGFGIVAAADLAVCAYASTFTFSEVRIGVAPASPCSAFGRCHPAAAHRYMLTGERFDPREAQEAGLISEVVPGRELVARAAFWREELDQCEPGPSLRPDGCWAPCPHWISTQDSEWRLRSRRSYFPRRRPPRP